MTNLCFNGDVTLRLKQLICSTHWKECPNGQVRCAPCEATKYWKQTELKQILVQFSCCWKPTYWCNKKHYTIFRLEWTPFRNSYLPMNIICPVLIQSSIHFLLHLTISVEMHFLAHVLISCFQHFHFSVTVIWPGSRRQDTSQVTDVSLSPPPYSVPPLTITLTKETTQVLRMLSRSLSDCKSL